MSLSNKAAEGSGANRVRLEKMAHASARSPMSRPLFAFTKPLSDMRKCRRGAAAVEFAMVLPVLMALTFGTFEYGIAFYTFNTMQAATRDVGRQIAINTLPAGSAQDAVRARLPAWARNDATVTVTQSAPANPNTNIYTFVTTMPMDAATPVQFFSRLTNPTLRTELSMKQELPYVATP